MIFHIDETVRKLGVTHDQIADRIEYFIKVSGAVWRGFQCCPWGGGAHDYGHMDFNVENLRLGAPFLRE